MLFVGGRTVSRQGIAFDYSSPAELYLSRRRRRPTDYRRFATAAEAIRYAFEELRTRRSRSAWMQVGDEFFNKNEINRLYYPMSESLSAAPVRPHETDVSTRLSVRIDLASGGHLGSGKIALLEAIQEQKSISGAARSLGMPCLKAQRCLAAPPFVSASGPRGTGQGIGDWPLFLVKYRLAYANENNGDYIVTAFFQMSSPSGTGDAISNNVLVAQPTLAFGKGWGDFDIQSTISVQVPVDSVGPRPATGTTLRNFGDPILWNTTFQYHFMRYFWPELEVNYETWPNGIHAGLNQVMLTPGVIFGRFKIGDITPTRPANLIVGAGYQVAPNPVTQNNVVATLRITF
jgi:hypothetical protein